MSKIPFLKKPSPDIHGFDGLMMMTTVACSAMCIGYIYSMFRSYLPYFQEAGFNFSLKTAQFSDVFRTYEFIAYVIIVVILAATAILLFKENRNLIKFVNIAYPVYILLFIAIYIIGANVFGTGYHKDFFIDLSEALVFPILVLIYINKSLRIKNTILLHREIDYVKLAKEKRSKKSKPNTQNIWKEANKKVYGKKK
jgi:hypothetical protein